MAILDETANNNDGSYNGSLYQQTGKIGYSLGFDGSDWVAVADSPSLDTSEITIAFWYYVTAWGVWGNGYTEFIERIYGGTGDYFFVQRRGSDAGDNKMTFGMQKDGNGHTILSNDDVDGLDVWRHVACTWDGLTMKMYLDGVLQDDTTETATSVFSSTRPIALGRSGTGAGFAYLIGSLDEVMIWGKALTATEISTYNDWDYIY